MKALCWYGTHKVRVENVPDPQILNPRDAIVKITSTAICGSDLHLYDGYIPAMEKGDILGHEFMGEVVEVGKGVENLKKGDRVVVPFTIACGHCFFCQKQLWSLCDNSNPNARMAEKLYGYSPSGLFGYSHMLGGYAGGQAELVRVPFADVGPIRVPDGISDEEALQHMTGGRGPDGCIDAVGLEAHGTSPGALYDWAKTSVRMATDRPNVLRQAILACRKGGTVSVPGVYGGFLDKLPFGAAFSKGLTFKMGQTHMHKYMRPLLERIERGEIDPSFIITHRVRLGDGPRMYDVFKRKEDDCVK